MNEKYINHYLILPADDGTRADTKLAVELSDEDIKKLISTGYILVGNEDFQKLIGNEGVPYGINKDGSLFIVPPKLPSLDDVKAEKIAELKDERDTLEVEPIEYNGNYFDYDDKARDRINAAIIALDSMGEGASIDWTTADDSDVEVTANDLRAVIANVAVRSNKLHIAYRNAKAKVEEASTVEEVEAVKFELA